MKPLHVSERPESGEVLSGETVVQEQSTSSHNEDHPDFAAASQSIASVPLNERLQKRHQAARRALLTSSDLNELQRACVNWLLESCPCVILAWYHPAGAQIGQSARLEGLSCPADGINPELKQRLEATAAASHLRGDILSEAHSNRLQIYAMPVCAYPGHCLLLVAERDEESRSDSEITGSLLMLSSMLGEWSLQRVSVQTAVNAKTVAALIELIAQVQTADDADTACQRLTDLLLEHFKAEKVVAGLCRSGSAEVQLSAISGGAVIDRFSEETRLIESVLQESIIRSASAQWPVADSMNRHSLLSHQQLVEAGFADRVVSMPIRTESGVAVGSLLVGLCSERPAFSANAPTASEQPASAAEVERFLRAGAGAFAGCLSVLQKLADSRWLRIVRGVRRAFSASRLQVAGWLIGGVAMILMLPMTYRVKCDLELQPVERKYIAAPFDGPLEECLVEPGDVVEENQLLARMDGREIRWELAEVQANLNKATKERNTQLSRKEFGNAAITGHEMERLEQRAALLVHRNESLEIRSPGAGIVVSGDHREAEGVPLEMGKTLFEIAPLDAMVVELLIPEEDIRHVQTGFPVSIQLEAIPEQPLQTIIRSVHPRAELRDGANVFVAEADIPNDDFFLRPGMRGKAKVSTERHALGWILFHKPVAWLAGWLGW